jgi:hypothetical protein
MITYDELNKMCERWRTGIPILETEEERRIVWLALAAAKAQLKGNENCPENSAYRNSEGNIVNVEKYISG